MEYRRFENKIIARIDKGEEIIDQLVKISKKENIKLASVSALGATNKFTVGLFDIEEKKYYSTTHEGNFEIVSLTGTISEKDNEVYQHIHMSAADKENKVYGGHLNSCLVSATCEMVIDIIDGVVKRKFDETIGLNLFQFPKEN